MCILCEIERGRRLENTIANDALMTAIKDLSASIIARSQAGSDMTPSPVYSHAGITKQSKKLPDLASGSVAYQRLLDRVTESNRQVKVLHSAIADAREMGYISDAEFHALNSDLS